MTRRNAVLLTLVFVLGPVWFGAGPALGALHPGGPVTVAAGDPLVTVSTATSPVPLTPTLEARSLSEEPSTVATDVVNDTANDVADTVTDTTGEVTDTVEDTAEDTTDSAGDNAGDATEVVNETTDAVDDTVRHGTDDVNGTVNLTSPDNSAINASIVDEFDLVVRATPPLAVPGVTVGGEKGTGSDTPVATGDGVGSPTRQSVGGPPPASTDEAATTRNGRIPIDDIPVGPVGATAVGAVILAVLARNAAPLSGQQPGVGAIVSRPSLVTGLRAPVDWGVGWFWRLLGAFGYSRYDDSSPLDHAIRAQLFRQIVDAPGTYLSEASDNAGVPISTARHHFRILEAEHLVTGSTIRGKRRYFPIGTDDTALAAALADEAPAAALRTLFQLGPSSVTALADELDRDVSTLTHHLKRLEEAGLVEREREGRAVVNRLSPEVVDWFRTDATDGTTADAATD